MGVEIRTLRADEAGRLAELAGRLFRETYLAECRAEDVEAYARASFAPERQAAELAEPGTAVLWAEVEGESCGYALLRTGAPPAQVPGRLAVEVARFYVDARWHGRGVAGALMDAALAWAHARGADGVWLAVWERNGRAIRFYERNGFRRVGRATFTMGDDVQDDFVMARPIAG